jgi:hypothetical protein
MNSSVVWDVTPCSQLEVNLGFGRKTRLHLQGRKVNQAVNQLIAGSKQSCAWMKEIGSSETSVDFQGYTWRYISENRTACLLVLKRL